MIEKITGHCKCNKPNWVVITRNGYKVMHTSGIQTNPAIIGSKYSTIKCLNCNKIWRTKAKYVDILKDIRDVI